MKTIWFTMLLLQAFVMPPAMAADSSKPTADSGAAPPNQSPNERSAIKLAGLVTFVASSCPDLATDYDRFKTAVTALGVSPQALSENERKVAYLNYAAVYQTDVAGNCARAKAQFGAAGTTMAGLFHAK